MLGCSDRSLVVREMLWWSERSSGGETGPLVVRQVLWWSDRSSGGETGGQTDPTSQRTLVMFLKGRDV